MRSPAWGREQTTGSPGPLDAASSQHERGRPVARARAQFSCQERVPEFLLAPAN